jgi:predicted AlkP superfamily pyrophosphatase or phosphodiesterase
MKRILALLTLSVLFVSADSAAPPPPKPKLILAIVIDQFRYDYLTRFRHEYRAGIARLLDHGAVFTSAYYEHFPPVTAVGHSTILSGATPTQSGIVANEWVDRITGKEITSVSDTTVKLLGGKPGDPAASPNRLLVSTVGDELKIANNNQTKVIGVSSKDRSAILPAGRMANGAFWFDTGSGNFVSSSYYFEEMPAWAAKYNASRAVDKYLGKGWLPFDAKAGANPYTTLPSTPDKTFYDALERTPYGNEIIEQFAEAALDGEKMGRGPGTDILAVSFSANDRIGHILGPDDPQIRDISIQTDRIIGRLLTFAETKSGPGNVLVVLTADHGVSPVPAESARRHMPGGFIKPDMIVKSLQSALSSRYGDGDWVQKKTGLEIVYLDRKLITGKKLKEADVQNTAAEALRAIPHIARVYTRAQLMNGEVLDDEVDRRIRRGFNPARSADLFVVLEPYWVMQNGDTGTSHTSPYNYDTHVPVIFMGPGIKPGRYNGRIAVNDIAPTLATMLDVETPSGSVGRVLDEILTK